MSKFRATRLGIYEEWQLQLMHCCSRGRVTHQLPAFTVARTYPMGFHVTDDALDRLVVIPGSGILGAPLYPQLMQLPLNSHLLSLLGFQDCFQLLHTGTSAVSGQAGSQTVYICPQLPSIAPDLTCKASQDCRSTWQLKPRDTYCQCNLLQHIV